MKYKVKKPKIFKLKKLKNFFLLHHMACKDLSSPSRDQTQAHDSESPNHWTTRNFKQKSILSLYISSEQLETQNSIYVKIWNRDKIYQDMCNICTQKIIELCQGKLKKA